MILSIDSHSSVTPFTLLNKNIKATQEEITTDFKLIFVIMKKYQNDDCPKILLQSQESIDSKVWH